MSVRLIIYRYIIYMLSSTRLANVPEYTRLTLVYPLSMHSQTMSSVIYNYCPSSCGLALGWRFQSKTSFATSCTSCQKPSIAPSSNPFWSYPSDIHSLPLGSAPLVACAQVNSHKCIGEEQQTARSLTRARGKRAEGNVAEALVSVHAVQVTKHRHAHERPLRRGREDGWRGGCGLRGGCGRLGRSRRGLFSPHRRDLWSRHGRCRCRLWARRLSIRLRQAETETVVHRRRSGLCLGFLLIVDPGPFHSPVPSEPVRFPTACNDKLRLDRLDGLGLGRSCAVPEELGRAELGGNKRGKDDVEVPDGEVEI